MDDEGVTKFQLQFRPGPPPQRRTIATLNAWRTVLHRLGLVAQDPERYEGVDFGNVSIRATGNPPDPHRPLFWISGTQTGRIAMLDTRHYCGVLDYDLAHNLLIAAGPIPPSSESLTHAALYRAAPSVRCVLHVHSPDLWRHAERLGIPIIDRRIAYGTPGMADAVGRLGATTHLPGLLAMAGHLDGIVAYGSQINETASTLILYLSRALACQSMVPAIQDSAT